MRSWLAFVALLVVVPSESPFAQQSQMDTRRLVEQMATVFSEYYNKQDAAAAASMFTKDAVRVSWESNAVSTGPRAIEETFQSQFKSGFRHIDLVVDQVSPLGTDAAITVGTYQITGQGQGLPLKVAGRWTELEVREESYGKFDFQRSRRSSSPMQLTLA
jgi:uncharacterized protein (TIGR02246 family)